MKAIILNGARKDDNALDSVHEIIIEELAGIGWEVKSFALCEIKIAYCLGCFECWVKTPGICRFNDDGREIAGQFYSKRFVHYIHTGNLWRLLCGT